MEDVPDDFAEVMLVLAEAFGVRLSEQRHRIYYAMLKDVPVADVKRAAQACMKESRYFPTVSELRQFAAPSVEDAALIAWTGFAQAAGTVGAYASLEVDDPVAADALARVFGGWPEYCEAEGAAVGARRSEFTAAYRDARRTQRERGPVRLQGLCERNGDAAPSQWRLEGREGVVTWVGRMSLRGEVAVVPDRPQVPALPDRSVRRAGIPEAGTAEADQG